ncbi:hypothetical protein DOY81_011048 [Sarcophaga bullata]|nr:hypothetical protein DOY81_011048 [Sarcophaga bullata]
MSYLMMNSSINELNSDCDLIFLMSSNTSASQMNVHCVLNPTL